MPSYLSGPEVEHEERLAGGLYFFVIGRIRLELGDDGAATLVWEVVVDSWYEPHEPRTYVCWSGTHERGRLELTSSRGDQAVGWVKATQDGAWLVVTDWEGAVNPGVRVFQRSG